MDILETLYKTDKKPQTQSLLLDKITFRNEKAYKHLAKKSNEFIEYLFEHRTNRYLYFRRPIVCFMIDYGLSVKNRYYIRQIIDENAHDLNLHIELFLYAMKKFDVTVMNYIYNTVYNFQSQFLHFCFSNNRSDLLQTYLSIYSKQFALDEFIFVLRSAKDDILLLLIQHNRYRTMFNFDQMIQYLLTFDKEYYNRFINVYYNCLQENQYQQLFFYEINHDFYDKNTKIEFKQGTEVVMIKQLENQKCIIRELHGTFLFHIDNDSITKL